MTNEKKPQSWIAIILALILGVGGTGAYLGFTGNESGSKFNVYGTDAGTTKVTSTVKTLYFGSSNSTLNLTLKTSSTAAQTLTLDVQVSNDSSDCSAANYARQSLTSVSSGAVTVTTSTYTIQVPASPSIAYYQNFQIADLNTECLQLSFTGSSSTITSLMWAEGIKK